MIPKIELFFFIVGIVFCLKHLIQVIMVIKQDNPTPMKLSTVNQILLYIAVSYVLTYIIGLFIW